jgi:acyl dehydratase
MSQAGVPGEIFVTEKMDDSLVFEDFRVGECVISPGRTLTEADLGWFAELTGHRVAVSLDGPEEMSAFTPNRVAAGFLTLAICSGLMFRAGGRGVPRSTIALWGINNARFVAHAEVGDTIHVETTITQLAAVDTWRGLITYEHRVFNQRCEEILTYVSKLVVARRRSEVDAEAS